MTYAYSDATAAVPAAIPVVRLMPVQLPMLVSVSPASVSAFL